MAYTKLLDLMGWENLQDLDPEALYDDQALVKIKEIAEDPLFDSEPGSARQFYENIEALLKKAHNSSAEEFFADKSLLGEIIVILAWKSFPALSNNLRNDILSKALIKGLSQQIDVKNCITKTLLTFETRFVPEKDLRRNFTGSMEANKEQLGDKNLITTEKKTLENYVSNWLVIYNESHPLGRMRGKFEQINFLNTNQNVLSLSSVNKETLAKVLDVYDWLLFPVSNVEIINGPDSLNRNSTNQSFTSNSAGNRPSAPAYMNKSRTTLPTNNLQIKIPNIPPSSSGLKLGILKDLNKPVIGEKVSMQPAKLPPLSDIVSKAPQVQQHGEGDVTEEIDEKLEVLKEKVTKNYRKKE